MFIRCAFFEGKVHDGCEQKFADFVRDRLLPLWTKFPGAQEVRVLRQTDSDTMDPHYAMILAIAYPSLAAMDEALKSDVRAKSREVTGELVKMFDGRIFHTVFNAAHDVSTIQPPV
jgi:hypothetical protein